MLPIISAFKSDSKSDQTFAIIRTISRSLILRDGTMFRHQMAAWNNNQSLHMLDRKWTTDAVYRSSCILVALLVELVELLKSDTP